MAVTIVNAVDHLPDPNTNGSIVNSGRALLHMESRARRKMPLDPRSSDTPSIDADAHCLSSVDGLERGCNHVESR
jgi:hypothetical protein